MALDQMLRRDHRAWVVWQYVESLDVQPLYASLSLLTARQDECHRTGGFTRTVADGNV